MFLGFVEALVSNLGEEGSLYPDSFDGGLPDTYFFKLLYGSAILLFCLVVCLVGAGGEKEELASILLIVFSGLFAKTTFVIFLLVMVSIISCLVSTPASCDHHVIGLPIG